MEFILNISHHMMLHLIFPEMYDADRIVPGWAIRVEWKVEE